MAKRKIEIEKIGSSIAVRVQQKDGSYSDNQYYPVANIRAVESQAKMNFAPVQADNNRLINYPYTDKLLICLNFVEGSDVIEYFDVQDVTNQVGWTADEAGLTQAVEDINEWLSEDSAGATASLEAIEDSLTGTFTPGVIDLNVAVYPYTFPAATYKSATIVIGTGSTIDFNGVTLVEGTYAFSGAGDKFCGSFALTNPSPVAPDAYILVTT